MNTNQVLRIFIVESFPALLMTLCFIGATAFGILNLRSKNLNEKRVAVLCAVSWVLIPLFLLPDIRPDLPVILFLSIWFFVLFFAIMANKQNENSRNKFVLMFTINAFAFFVLRILLFKVL